MDEDISALLARTNDLLGILVKAQLRQVIEAELAESKKRRLYELTGEEIPVKALSRRLDMSTGAISRTWQRWDELGLLIKRNGKYRRTIE